jgi:hypothetical protein
MVAHTQGEAVVLARTGVHFDDDEAIRMPTYEFRGDTPRGRLGVSIGHLHTLASLVNTTIDHGASTTLVPNDNANHAM